MDKYKTPRLRVALSLTAAAALAACASAPTSNARLDEARAFYQQAAADPVVARGAPLELKRASDALQRAEAGLRAGADTPAVEHQAYIARQQAAIAMQAGQITLAEQAVSDSQAQRDRILLDARTREASVRLAQAERAKTAAEQAQSEAERARGEAEKARKLADERLAAAKLARDQASVATTRAGKLQAQLDELQAKQTERGMVLTLGDVLFDSGRAELKPGANQTIDRLAAFMQENRERKLTVEGYTDSVGSDDFNLTLSQRRADAVRDALAARGVDGVRIETRGFGKASPVASNSTAAGRQRNRRIEIVISATS
jgi:outer membrane protein OmpA-like peptidoglycan-associated protein